MRTLGIAAALVAVAACGREAADDGPLEPEPIGATGAVVDAPRAWAVTGGGEVGYRIGKGVGRQVFVDEVTKLQATPAELYAAECAYATAAGIQETLPSGALFVQCSLPGVGKDGGAIAVTHIASLIKIGERGFKCHVGTPHEPRELLAVCRSLRAR